MFICYYYYYYFWQGAGDPSVLLTSMCCIIYNRETSLSCAVIKIIVVGIVVLSLRCSYFEMATHRCYCQCLVQATIGFLKKKKKLIVRIQWDRASDCELSILPLEIGKTNTLYFRSLTEAYPFISRSSICIRNSVPLL